MGRINHTQELFVYMNGELVGKLYQKLDGVQNFAYDQGWLISQKARPISLSMPLTDKVYSGTTVYNFFDNLLPDNRLIRDRIQHRFGAKTTRCFDLLFHIGADCAGALQLLNHPLDESIIYSITWKVLDEQKIATLLMNYKTAPLGMEEDSDFRISIAGAQEKTALLRHKDQWYLPQGTTPTTHILKLPIGHIEHFGIDLTESVENEWLCMHILQEFGLPTANVAMGNFFNVKALVVERFDRVWSKDHSNILRIPQEDMCQALGISANLKYECDGGPGIKNIMDILLGSSNAVQDRHNFMRSVFLFWVMCAIDGHAKNFSIILEAGGKYKLSPLYDVISAYPLTMNRNLESKKIKMAMSVGGKSNHYRWSEIQLRHWLDTAEVCKFSKSSMQAIIDETFDRLDLVLEKVGNKIPEKFPLELADSIFTHMQSLKSKK